MPFVNSPNMGLPIPGISTEPGPQFANDINQALSILDSHTHGPGSGVPIGSQSISLQSDLAFNVNNATSLRTVRFISTTATSGTDVGCVYVKGIDLFYNDLNANVVRLTANGGLASTSLTQGVINSTAIISANSPQIPATSGFIRMNNNGDFVSWRNAANTADDKIFFDSSDNLQVLGNVNGGVQTYGVRLLDQVAGKVVYLNTPQSTSAYTLTVPPQAPQATNLLLMNSSGGLNQNLAIVCGSINPDGSSATAFGASIGSTRVSGGNYNIAFTPPFSPAAPFITFAPTSGNQIILYLGTSLPPSSVNVNAAARNDGSLTDVMFNFIAIGRRA